MSKDADEQMLPLMTLTAMAVRGMVGAGIFSIPHGRPVIHGALIAWAIAGAGMPMLRLVFQTLADRKPKSKETMIFVGSAGIVFV
jgi:arginine:ornithine antiporter / lysine permease